MKPLKTIFALIVIVLMAFSGHAQVVKEESVPGDPGKMTLRFYPNPATDFVTVRSEEPVMKEAKITLHNIIGNEMSVEKEVIDEHEVRLHVKGLATGYYMVTVNQPNSTHRNVFKFLKRESLGL